MAEPDDLYTLRAQFWLGHYELCLEEAKSIARRPMAPHLKQEREEFTWRAHLALGQHEKVAAAGRSDSSTGECVEIVWLFDFVSAQQGSFWSPTPLSPSLSSRSLLYIFVLCFAYP